MQHIYTQRYKDCKNCNHRCHVKIYYEPHSLLLLSARIICLYLNNLQSEKKNTILKILTNAPDPCREALRVWMTRTGQLALWKTFKLFIWSSSSSELIENSCGGVDEIGLNHGLHISSRSQCYFWHGKCIFKVGNTITITNLKMLASFIVSHK